jgi:hypothetical protein
MWKSTDIVGYADTENGVCYCLDCIEEGDDEKFTPIFLDEVLGDPAWKPCCDECLKLLWEGEVEPEREECPGCPYYSEFTGCTASYWERKQSGCEEEDE